MVEADPSLDAAYMERALDLARQGRGWTSPAPMSGAVIVKDGEVVGEGFSSTSGPPHAEQFALDAAGDRAKGAELYLVTEPCQVRDGCAQRIVAAGIGRVVLAMEDPNPSAAGRGIALLRSHGVTLSLGVGSSAARQLNETASKFLATRRPFVTLATAMSFDGKIATVIGERPELPIDLSADLRATYDAILVGVGTVLEHDPDLSTSKPRSRNPLRIVVDGMARTPPNCKFLAGSTGTRGLRPATLVVTTRFAPADRVRALQEHGAEILVAPEEEESMTGDVDLDKLIALLGRRDISSILIETGGSLVDAALTAGILDKLVVYLAPTILGGSSAPGLFGGMGSSFVEQAPQLHGLTAKPCGDGLLLEAYLNPR
ncbi:MAG: bifunctional diaminohydroxyphosphoribosylaminopyrimidine deaminase/5-amino-6-(5-phosphoribosylamino)uracil reductase RibD [Cyanobacteria bacterium REEB65]|nr:bifunctional diaminohydroxyphosphoribosylaminopyrimidine deaminase/5-amino-6-(5-phosphoribosylamino)uracil reductase RibD [Cyanobacteria bacterium REEB65]